VASPDRPGCADTLFGRLSLAAVGDLPYIQATGDLTVLDEQAAFLAGRPVNPEEDSYYDLPGRSQEVASLYQHCVRAILHGLRFGAHGLPLMGSGDWNDGMNLVGMGGKGESVWLGFSCAKCWASLPGWRVGGERFPLRTLPSGGA